MISSVSAVCLSVCHHVVTICGVLWRVVVSGDRGWGRLLELIGLWKNYHFLVNLKRKRQFRFVRQMLKSWVQISRTWNHLISNQINWVSVCQSVSSYFMTSFNSSEKERREATRVCQSVSVKKSASGSAILQNGKRYAHLSSWAVCCGDCVVTDWQTDWLMESASERGNATTHHFQSQ